MRDPETQNCGTCAFSAKRGTATECRRMAPGYPAPRMDFEFWCGEFRPKRWWDQWKKPEGDNVREAGQ